MKWQVITLLLLSALSHFVFFGRPAQVVFDEVHFGSFASSYDTGKYFFDVHPPLGKLMISASGAAAGYQATTTNYANIGNVFVDSRYVWYRILPMLAGFMLPLIIYFLCLRLRFGFGAAFLAGLTVILENSILVQSRFIFLDIFILLFGFFGLLCYFAARQSTTTNRRRILMFLAAMLVTLAFSIKWTGLSFLGFIVTFEILDLLKNVRFLPVWKKFIWRMGSFAFIGFGIYFLIFAVHFSLLTKTGPGDAFMSASFQKTLSGSAVEKDISIKPEGLVGKFTELNLEMFRATKSLTVSHPYSSMWYSWPVMQRPIYYWVHDNTASSSDPHDILLNSVTASSTIIQTKVESKIYLLGNPFIYWFGAISVVLLLVLILSRSLSPAKEKDLAVPVFLFIGFMINWLPFIFIGRVMFLYHYLPALVFSIMIMAYLVDQISSSRLKWKVIISLTILFVGSFLFFSPLSYGLPMNEKAQNSRFWFKTWI